MTPFTILLVDDNAHIAELLTRAAASTFPEAVFIPTSTYDQAARYLGDLTGRGPRLMLLDIHLHTGLSGLDFLSLVRQHPQGHLIPIIMLSASHDPADRVEAYRRGANVYSRKPFSFQAWKRYVGGLRTYWLETATLPAIWFQKEADE
ncbi:response regulator [Spirosoma sp.]|uniref:response regulator n=1 Tax=Spirosoma sp. TaxID=1899569 RepID=UPI002626F877|nr:response regulator [Spirosoma sp.]MCX6212892.1 response regulator [Spirosoma sp.]